MAVIIDAQYILKTAKSATLFETEVIAPEDLSADGNSWRSKGRVGASADNRYLGS